MNLPIGTKWYTSICRGKFLGGGSEPIKIKIKIKNISSQLGFLSGGVFGGAAASGQAFKDFIGHHTQQNHQTDDGWFQLGGDAHQIAGVEDGSHHGSSNHYTQD